MTLTTSSRTAVVRVGFTMVELLVVIMIIAILVAITGVALQKTVEGSKNRVTKEQLYKLQQSLDAEYDRVVKQCATDRDKGQIPDQVVKYCESDSNRALSVWTAMQLRRQFPDTFAEATSAITLPSTPPYSLPPMKTFALPGISGTHNEQSAILLYLILATKSASGGGAMANAADDLAAQTTITIGTTSFKVFKDGWDRPVRFHRWLTSTEVQNPPYSGSVNTYNSANKDPFDPRDLVAGWKLSDNSPNTARRSEMQALLGFNNLNRLITVYSIGKDGTEPTDDDLLGYRLRRFGATGTTVP